MVVLGGRLSNSLTLKLLENISNTGAVQAIYDL